MRRNPRVIASDSDSRFRFGFRSFLAENFSLSRHCFGNAFRLRPVTKNCLPRVMRIAYIAIHFDAFVVCTDLAFPLRPHPGKHPTSIEIEKVS
ncbi:hypothetical protein F7R13_11145 [Burkholderia territorii]|uniref:Uncharacterized protein n=1 Tax=Burkholderia territorii TaxID=1503055 RepID=A0A6L3NKC4_9BURK|nr:hypothetical protein F7R13_11145 [Burkholderia territorii]